MAELYPANTGSYKIAISLLTARQAVAVPTETIYGLAAIASDTKAVKNIFTIKNRPLSLPLSLCVFNQKQAEDICHVSPLAKRLMQAFWPGPLTLVLPKTPNANICNTANAGLPNIGIRCPDIPWRNAFIKLGFSQPLVLTSANTSSRPNPQSAQDVDGDIGAKIALIIDGGKRESTQASTIISIENEKAKILRAGALRPEDFAHLSIEWQI